MGAYLKVCEGGAYSKKAVFCILYRRFKEMKEMKSCFYCTQSGILLWHCKVQSGNKNKLRTFQPQKWKKIKNSQPQTKFTGSYKKKSVYLLLAKHFVSISLISNYYVIRRSNYFLCESSFSFLINRKLARGLCFLQTCEKFTSRKSSE